MESNSTISPTEDVTFLPPVSPDAPRDNAGPNIIGATVTTWTIACLFVLLRFWTRGRIARVLGPSDWFILLSLLASGGMSISYIVQVAHGTGKHVHDVDMLEHGSHIMKAWWFALLFYILTLFLTKVSICVLYLTIFTFEWIRKACYVVLFIVTLSSFWVTGAAFTYCIPLKATWDYTVKPSFCQPQSVWWANTGLVIATDFMIFLLPVPVVYPLKLPRRQKFALVTIFAIGFFVCLISLIRLWILIKTQSNPNPDFTYAGTPLIYWTVIEVDTAIVVACAMTLKPLITRFFPNLLIPRSIWDASVLESNGRPRTIGSAPWRPGGGARGIGDVGMESMRNGDSVDLGLGGGQVSPSEGTDVGSTWGRSNGEELGKMTAKSLG